MNAVIQHEPQTAVIPYSDIERMASALVASNLFDLTKKEHAIALMLVAQAEGLHPATVAVDYDFIQGKPSKKPVAMLRDFIRGGGKVEWHALNDAEAEATFSHPQGGTVRVRWDMAKAEQAQLTGKEMWKKYPAAMLRSRCVSEGLRAVFPAATGGLYTPEEVRDFDAPRAVETVTPIEGHAEPVPETPSHEYAHDSRRCVGRGKYRDTPWADVPRDYLEWAAKDANGRVPVTLREQCQAELEAREKIAAVLPACDYDTGEIPQ